MNLESPKVNVAKSAEYIFNALTDVKNFEKLMPESIAKFEVTGDDSFIFALKGMPEIKLKQKEQTPNSKVVLGAASEKLPFTLTGNITEVDANNSEVQLTFEGSFNPMMAMMVKGPIGKFIEALAGNMNKL
ncbi:MAG: SRPBCC family protein [Flavobacterium sp.]|uniref:SRPBCC family protein n=1 Tax=Myroides sp. N17-2 TaxID=2030799 RepID=UPI000EFB464A|nr:SRPBCC family protein [Myroides sp. N17-2]